jgi:GT2 family glycosyltransferase
VTTAPVTVVVPTFRRPRELLRCLEGLAAQTVAPAEVVVVLNAADGETPDAIRQTPLPVRRAWTRHPGVLAALRAGVARGGQPWFVFLDDDAVPRPDWLERIAAHLADPGLGAVGGRVDGGHTAVAPIDGSPARLSWFGKTSSNLHSAPPEPVVCDVDFLPGSNMCVRAEALGRLEPEFDCGMAPGFELALCQRLRRNGWAVRFDSEIVIDHLPAPRPGPARDDLVRYAYEYSRTLAYGLLRHLSWPRKFAFALYFGLVGQRHSPGLIALPAFFLRADGRARAAAAWGGRWDGLQAAWGCR